MGYSKKRAAVAGKFVRDRTQGAAGNGCEHQRFGRERLEA